MQPGKKLSHRLVMVNLITKPEQQVDFLFEDLISPPSVENNLLPAHTPSDTFQSLPIETLITNDLPQRSTLMPLKPMGRGTKLIESMTSYITRLAIVHSVSCSSLYRYIIVDRVIELFPCFGFGRKHLNYLIPHGMVPRYLNGSRIEASVIAIALETLTDQHSLKFLTTYPYTPITSKWSNHSVTGDLYWCPYCFQYWKDHNMTLYEPLIWLIKGVGQCPIHWCSLERKCPSCGSSFRYFKSVRFIGYCSKCGAWLGKPFDNSNMENRPGGWQPMLSYSFLIETMQMKEQNKSGGVGRKIILKMADPGGGMFKTCL